ncbi:unnamed protein product [Caenorhabditis bovis]|uniref:Uncharacterized protein n=1 Tax=Caenorhabditis bovis TaxID=2654633 RepID=A0A8S1FCI5_9PELO|nr:unnamed protein product [Caenorhabditis bovis]
MCCSEVLGNFRSFFRNIIDSRQSTPREANSASDSQPLLREQTPLLPVDRQTVEVNQLKRFLKPRTFFQILHTYNHVPNAKPIPDSCGQSGEVVTVKESGSIKKRIFNKKFGNNAIEVGNILQMDETVMEKRLGVSSKVRSDDKYWNDRDANEK